jgi:hypothetical protein
MNRTIDLDNAEKQVVSLAAFEDGIWEIYLGLFFVLMSFYSLTREMLGPILNAVFILGTLLLLAGLAWFAKKQISQPRIGVVKFGIKAKKKIKAANIILLVLVLATFVLLILSANSLIDEPTWRYLPQWLSDFDIDMIFALVTVSIFYLIGYHTGTARFYLHGVLLGVGNFATTVLFAYSDVKFGWPIALAGLIVAGIGTSILVKFLQTHPLPVEETPGDQ